MENTEMPRFITERQASKITGLSRAFFQRKRHEGGGPPFVRTSKRGAVRYPLNEFLGWFESRMVKESGDE